MCVLGNAQADSPWFEAPFISTCMVCPSIAFTTSPGFKAHAEGMFSQSGARTTMFIGSCKADAADTTDTTHAAPPMSALILSMLADGFSDIPPVSNVTPK